MNLAYKHFGVVLGLILCGTTYAADVRCAIHPKMKIKVTVE